MVPATNEIIRLHKEIEDSLRTSLEKGIRIGELLAQMKADLKHGEFTAWIGDNLPFTDRTARNYMKLYDHRDRILQAGTINEAYRMLTEGKTETVSDLNLIKISDVVCKKEYFGRFAINYDMVKIYSEIIGDLPPIEINQDNILIDGWHRLEASKLANREYIPYFITKTNSGKEIYILFAKRNSKHGLSLYETRNKET